MKSLFNRIISVFLAVTIIFSSAIVGIYEMDFSSLFSIEAEAASSGKCTSTITWVLDDDGVLTLSGRGNIYVYTTGTGYTWWDSANVKSIIIEDGITEVPDCRNYPKLESVKIGGSVTNISNFAFENCTNLTSVTIPNSVTKIGTSAFKSCTSLTSITIPNSVTKIGTSAFKSCTSLTSITIPDSVTEICSDSFTGCTNLMFIDFGDNLTSVGFAAFYGCTNLTSITIPDSVTKIGSSAFEGCTSLISITIPDYVKSIGERAFGNCTSLATITIPDNAVVGRFAFENTAYYNNESNWENAVLYIGNHLIEAQKSISGHYQIKSGIKNISGYAFYDCTNLTSITIPDSVTSIGESTFVNCKALTTITIPDSVTSIGESAFNNCTALTTITIPDAVTNIGSYAFNNCKSLTSIAIPDGVTIIDWWVFNDCSSLVSVTIPKSVEEICWGAFCDCISVDSIFYTGTQQEWEQMRIDGYNDALKNKTIHFESTDHTYSEWIISKQPNCTESGCKYKECTVCNKILKEETINATGHKAGDWQTDKEATVYKAGLKHKVCTVCGETVETGTIKQLKCDKPSLKKIENTADGVKLTWDKVEGADKYEVYYRKGSKGKYTKLGTTSKNYVTHKKATSGNKYYYYVKAINEVGASSASKSKLIYYLADPTLKTPKSTKSGIVLKWNKIAGAYGYMVYRKTGSGSYSKIATVKGNSKVTYTDKKAKKGKTYTYKVKAYKSKISSAYSNTKKIKDKY